MTRASRAELRTPGDGGSGVVKLSVIIPVYNERATIAEILARVRAVTLEKEILIVDDGSTDGTRDWLMSLAEPDVQSLSAAPESWQGRRGARRSRDRRSGEIAIIQDADLEYDPADYPKLVAPIAAGEAQVVYGSRFLARRTPRHGLLALRRQSRPDADLEPLHRAASDRHGDLLQSLPPRPAAAHRTGQ